MINNREEDLIFQYFKNIGISKMDKFLKKQLISLFKENIIDGLVKVAREDNQKLFFKVFDINLKEKAKYELLKIIYKSYFMEKNYQKSIEIVEYILNNFQLSLKEELIISYNLASMYHILQKFQKENEVLTKCIDIINSNKVDFTDIEIFRAILRINILYIGNSLALEKDIKDIYLMTKTLVKLLEKSKTILRNEQEIKFFEIEAYIQIVYVLLNSNMIDEALKYVKVLSNIVDSKKYFIPPETLFEIYLVSAMTYFRKDEIQIANEYLKYASKYSNKLPMNDKRKEILLDLKEDVDKALYINMEAV